MSRPSACVEELGRILLRCQIERNFLHTLCMHDYMRETGLQTHSVLGNCLVSLLVQMKSIYQAQHVFDQLPHPDECLWNSLIVEYVQQEKFCDAIVLYERMRNDSSLQPNGYVFVALLKACATIRDLGEGLKLHEHIAKTQLQEKNVYVGSALVDMFAKCGSLMRAQEVFDQLTRQSLVLWNALITGYADYGHGEKVLSCLKQMQQEGFSPDAVTYVCGLRACGSTGGVFEGWQIYLEIAKKGLDGNVVVGSTLVDMFAKCGCLARAQEVLDKLTIRNVVSWNALITGYLEHGQSQKVFSCSERMKSEGISANGITLACVLKSCGYLGHTEKGQDIHAEICKKGLDKDVRVGCSLVDMYAKLGILDSALQIFSNLPSRDVVLWNALIAGYVDHAYDEEALNCFKQMQRHCFPNSATYVCSLKACISTRAICETSKMHVDILKRGLDLDLFVGSSLMDMYAKNGLLLEAQCVSDKLPLRTAVTWNSLIAGYADCGQGEESLDCYKQMQHEGFPSDAITLVCSLKSCGITGNYVQGQEIFSELTKKGFSESDSYTGSALVDAYASWGMVAEAELVFKRLQTRDEFTFIALITGYVESGHSQDAFDLFDCMREKGILFGPQIFVCILRGVGSKEVVGRGQDVHDEIIQKGLERDRIISTNLVEMYSKCGCLAEALEISKAGQVSEVDAWTALITGYAEHVGGEAALDCFEQMLGALTSPSISAFVFSMKACGSLGATIRGRELHAEIVKKGMEKIPFIANALIDMHAKCCLLEEAQAIFNGLMVRDVVTWNAIIAGYVDHGWIEEAIMCFERMGHQGISANAVTLVSILKACSSTGWMRKGQEFYDEVIRKGFEKEPFIGSALIDLFVKCNSLVEACKVFKESSIRVLVSWNAIIAGHSDSGQVEEALNYFEQMHDEGISADAVTFVSCLKACAATKSLDKGRHLHFEIINRGLEGEIPVGNILIDMYAKCSSLLESKEVFEKLPQRNVISCTAVLGGYIDCDRGEEALACLERMQQEGIAMGPVMYVCSLRACSSFLTGNKGQELHAEIVKKGLIEVEAFVGSTLVDMYTNCGMLAEAQNVFARLPFRDSISWTALIAGLSKHGSAEDALHRLEEMKVAGASPDAVTFVCSLKACGSTGATNKAKEIHVEIMKRGLESDLFIGEILVEVYAKCGLLTTAHEVFNKIHVREVLLWNALMAGYAQIGECDNIFVLFDKMVAEGGTPDVSTFINLLTACSHAGLVDEGHMCIKLMSDNYDVTPDMEHYSCMMDLLGRAGCIEVLVIMLNEVPFHPDVVLWLSVLGACRKWGIVELGRLAFENAVLLNEKDAVAYVGMSNIYADAAMEEGRHLR